MEFANHHGYTDINPYEVIRKVSEKCLEVRRMKCEKDPGFEIDFIPGGFCGTVVNIQDQKWIITPDQANKVIRIRKHKDGTWMDPHKNRFVLSDKPIHFYDYNF